LARIIRFCLGWPWASRVATNTASLIRDLSAAWEAQTLLRRSVCHIRRIEWSLCRSNRSSADESGRLLMFVHHRVRSFPCTAWRQLTRSFGCQRNRHGFVILANSSRGESTTSERTKSLILLSAIESRSAITVGKMADAIRLDVPDALILVGLWSLPTEGAARSVKRIRASSGSTLYTNIDEAVRGIVSLAPRAEDELSPENQDVRK
jgi:hypothetical protein